MKCFVIVKEASPGQFTAWPAGIPELKVIAESRERARDAVFSKLFDCFRRGELIALDIPEIQSFPQPEPIDPEIEAELQQTYLDEISRIRREADEVHGISNGTLNEAGAKQITEKLSDVA